MLTSARNQFAGKVTAIHPERSTTRSTHRPAGRRGDHRRHHPAQHRQPGPDRGLRRAGHHQGPWVILANPEAGIKLSTRNRLEGGVARCARAR